MLPPSHQRSALASLWYCRIHGLERGPITWDMLQGLAQSGDLRPSDLVRRGDQTQWVVASQARCEDPVPLPPPLEAPVETKLTARLAAALSVDVQAAHAPAQPFRRLEPVAPEATAVETSHGKAVAPDDTTPADVVTEDSSDAADAPSRLVVPATVDVTRSSRATRDDSIDEDGPVMTLVDESEEAPRPASPSPVRLSAAATALAVRNAKRRNPAGVALLALGLALVGLFKLALPLGLLSLYLAWRSASDLRSRPAERGSVPSGIGLATAVAAMTVAAIDVGVSVYHIAR